MTATRQECEDQFATPRHIDLVDPPVVRVFKTAKCNLDAEYRMKTRYFFLVDPVTVFKKATHEFSWTQSIIFLCIMPGTTGCDDSLLTSLFALACTEEARSEANGRMRRQQVVFGYPSIDYPHKCKFSFQLVLANTLEQLDMLQGLIWTNLLKRLPL
jgi:hypothetical protein